MASDTDKEKVQLRPARLRDLFRVLRLRNAPEIVMGSRSKRRAPPSWFWKIRRWMQVIEHEGRPVGYMLIVPVWEVSIVLEAAHRGHGDGTAALRHVDAQTMLARIHPDNAASLAAFTKAGFREDPTFRTLFRG